MTLLLPALTGFMSGNLHQDWDVEVSDPMEAVGSFAASEPLHFVMQAIGEGRVLLAMRRSEEELATDLLSMGCYYRPLEPCTIRAWLEELVDAMARTMAARLNKP